MPPKNLHRGARGSYGENWSVRGGGGVDHKPSTAAPREVLRSSLRLDALNKGGGGGQSSGICCISYLYDNDDGYKVHIVG